MSDSFTTSKGVTVEFVPIAMLVDKLNAEFVRREPEPPTYEIKTLTGAIEKHIHDETTVTTDEEKAALVKYHADKYALRVEIAEKMTELYFLCGLKVEMPADDTWAKVQEFLGVQVPVEPYKRKVHWIYTEAIGTPEELKEVMSGVARASGAPEEYLQQAEDSFRRALGKSDGNETSTPATASNGAGVVLQSKVRAGENGSQDGADGKPVRRSKRRG